jgi:hypothetical protein
VRTLFDYRHASLARMEVAIKVLSSRKVSPGWKFDQKSADRALAYLRHRAAKGWRWRAAIDRKGEQEIATFCEQHDVSLDWLLRGDMAPLLCAVAKGSA